MGELVAGSVHVHVRFFAAAAEYMGIDEQTFSLEGQNLPLSEALDQLSQYFPDALMELLPSCSYFRNEVSARMSTAISHDDVIDVLPPFAGG